MSNIIYSTIFGGYDEPITQSLPKNWDWKCFSEENSLSLYSDDNRNAKRFKVLPHRYLKDYEYSIFIDGNMTILGDVDELVDEYLGDSNIALYDHGQNKLDSRNCLYEEAKIILYYGKLNTQRCQGGEPGWQCEGQCTNGFPYHHYKDNAKIIENQVNGYYTKGFPPNNGLATTMVILRRHNEKDCIELMENWWTEIQYGSRRDQLSFNYVA